MLWPWAGKETHGWRHGWRGPVATQIILRSYSGVLGQIGIFLKVSITKVDDLSHAEPDVRLTGVGV